MRDLKKTDVQTRSRNKVKPTICIAGGQDPNDGDFEEIGFQSQQGVIIVNHTSVGHENSQEMLTSKLWQTVHTREEVREPLIGVDTSVYSQEWSRESLSPHEKVSSHHEGLDTSHSSCRTEMKAMGDAQRSSDPPINYLASLSIENRLWRHLDPCMEAWCE